MQTSQTEAFFKNVDVKGKKILDIGCWEGNFCIQMLNKGDAEVTGIDYCTSSKLKENEKNPKFTYVQMDIFSEKIFHIPQHDIVTCAGVLYHVENPLSLLMRLRSLSKETLFIETAISTSDKETSVMQFHKNRMLANNPSNWWTPNRLCLKEMLEASIFENVKFIDFYKADPPRVSVVCNTSNKTTYDKLAPRLESKMEIAGGNRSNDRGKKT